MHSLIAIFAALTLSLGTQVAPLLSLTLAGDSSIAAAASNRVERTPCDMYCCGGGCCCSAVPTDPMPTPSPESAVIDQPRRDGLTPRILLPVMSGTEVPATAHAPRMTPVRPRAATTRRAILERWQT